MPHIRQAYEMTHKGCKFIKTFTNMVGEVVRVVWFDEDSNIHRKFGAAVEEYANGVIVGRSYWLRSEKISEEEYRERMRDHLYTPRILPLVNSMLPQPIAEAVIEAM